MIAPDVFRDQPALTGRTVRLEPLTAAVLDDYLVGLRDPQVRHLTGTTATFGHAQVEQWLQTRAEHHDRADWAALRIEDGAFLGEAVLNEFDVENESVNYRVWLSGPAVFGRGYGTEITGLVVDYALDVCGLHRVELGVYEFNPRARRAYEKAGFRLDGRRRAAHRSHGAWHDELIMSVLSDDVRPDRSGGTETGVATAQPR